MTIATHRGSRVKVPIPAEHWPSTFEIDHVHWGITDTDDGKEHDGSMGGVGPVPGLQDQHGGVRRESVVLETRLTLPPTIAGQLADLPIGHVSTINGRVVARWGPDEYEVVTYGRRVLDRATACIWVSD